MSSRASSFAARIATPALLVGAFLAFAGFPSALWFQQQTPNVAMPWSVVALGACCGVALLALLWFFRLPVVRVATRIGDLLSGRFAIPLAAGFVLRVLVHAGVRPLQTSDGATYLQIAQQIVASQPMAAGGTLAYWPPGLPFLLTPLLAVIGSSAATLLAYSLLAFLVTAFGTWRLGVALGLGGRAVLPVWLLAGWPTLVLMTGLAEKDVFLAGLLPWIVLAGLSAARGSWRAAVGCGLALGFATLMQPSLQLLVFVPFLATPWVATDRGRHLRHALVILLVTLATIAPWVVRNARVLDGTIAIATNGGGNLYRANNELATGGFTPSGRVDLDALDEVSQDRLGKRLAREWIVGNPGRFVQLAAGKALLFAGDDSHGAYVAIKRSQPPGETGLLVRLYPAIKLLAAAPWLLLWAMIGALAWARRDGASAVVLIPLIPYAYLASLHTIFESGGKYHIPVLCCLFVAFACLVPRGVSATGTAA